MPRRIAVVGFSMVGHKVIESLLSYGVPGTLITVFGREPYIAYDRVHLTEYTGHRDVTQLELKTLEWYLERGVHVHTSDSVVSVDPIKKHLLSEKGVQCNYDVLVLATGSHAFVPPIKDGRVRVYRTITDLDLILKKIETSHSACVIGGGLLGLEAARVCIDAGVSTVSVVDRGSHLMSRQLDSAGAAILKQKVESMGIKVYQRCCVERISGQVATMRHQDTQGSVDIPADLVIAAAGIRPADELARGIKTVQVHKKGGIVVDDYLRTTDPNIYAVGEVALHRGRIYGLVNPCYEQVKVLVRTIVGEETPPFEKGDTSARLKLLGTEVATFGDLVTGGEPAIYHDPFKAIYRKLIFSPDGTILRGGILIGDASDYATLQALSRAGKKLKLSPCDLVLPPTASPKQSLGVADMDDDTQVCSCNDVTKGGIAHCVEQGACTIADISEVTNAGTGCGGCKPLIKQVLDLTLKSLGREVSKGICDHFQLSRSELFHIVKVRKIKTFRELVRFSGKGVGCDICKPAVASILASVWNGFILTPGEATLQDTNDRFLANMQRDGTYSVVPRVPGGEITPKKLRFLGELAEKRGLYTKITGGQRIDLFGARKQDLPDIWEELVTAGFESGHAYGKALRTVKSCVGSTWCRYGMGDAVGFAIEIENRYKGIRSPHKIKGGVSGCIRECAEARSKDFGLIAVEGGYNLYVCGNGGTKPKHAELLAPAASEAQCIKYLDRFIGFYVTTAKRLQRTARWLEELEGGLDYLRDVVVHDKLGIAADLEAHIASLTAAYKCEWSVVVNDPRRKASFQQFVNNKSSQIGLEMVSQRGQKRPADWCSTGESLVKVPYVDLHSLEHTWADAGPVTDYPEDGGETFLFGKSQVAVFNFSSRGKWYATQNMCPHKNAFVLSQGILGEGKTGPTVSCPLHKRKYTLDGEATSDKPFYRFAVRVKEGRVSVRLPKDLDKILQTDAFNKAPCTTCGDKSLEW